MAKVTQVDFPPREIVSYTKETQTPVMTQQKEGDSLIKCVKPAPVTEPTVEILLNHFSWTLDLREKGNAIRRKSEKSKKRLDSDEAPPPDPTTSL